MREFTRALPTEVEVMGRTIEGITLRWNNAYRVSDDNGASFYLEGWRPGAFERGIKATGNVHEVRIDHRDVRVGRVAFHESAEGLPFTAIVDETPEGDATLDYARAGRFRGVSLRYASDQQRRDAEGVIWRTRGVPRELSLIDNGRPQYGDDARIIAVRSMWVEEPSPEDLQRARDLEALLARSRANLARELPPLVND
jgi:phage head maturation protease